jgi:uncharacterized paraquat-inducible protein A
MVARLGRWRSRYQGMACPRCHASLRHETLQNGDQACPACGGRFELTRFDPVESKVVVPDIAGTGPEGAAPCTRCGQFMCSLCRIDADQKTYCPSCFERLSAEGSLASAVTRVKNWAGWAGLCLVGCFFTSFFGAPVFGALGIYCAVRGLKDKRQRGETDDRGRLVLLMIFSILFFGIGVFIYIGIFGAMAMTKGAD